MTDVILHYKNELKCLIECDPGIAYEISESFTFFVDGYKFNPKYKAGVWDGRIRLFNVRTREFYIGLLPRLLDWLAESDYSVSIADKDKFKENRIPYDEELLERTFTQLGRFTPKWYQEEAVKTALKNQKTLILSPTGSGKSFIAYMLVRYLLEATDKDILITVPSTSLVEQLQSDFKDYVADDFDVEENVHGLYSGKEKNSGKRVVISTWQTAHRMHASWFQNFGAYICDEAHGADAKCISGIIDKMAFAPFRLGMTGTLKGTKMHELDMQARFGKIVRVANTRDLQDSGDLAPLKIECLHLQYPDDDIEIVRHLDYDKEIDFIISHPRRNKLLAKVALQQEGNTLMLFNFIERHGKVLFEMLKPMCEEAGKKLYYISGETAVEDRENIRQILEKNNNCILLASFGTTSVGVNIKNLHNIIFCHPYKATVKTLQSIGRGLRQAEKKLSAKLIDVCDDLTYTSKRGKVKHNTTYNHFIHRLEIYVEERFKYEIIKLKL